MKIVQINTFSNKSTGTIMMNIHKQLLETGYDSYVVWGRGRKANNDHEIYLNDEIGVIIHGLYTRLTDKTGFASKRCTKKLIKRLNEIKPDIIHLHNIHGYFINIELLFKYIKENNIRVIWTLHDCWSFTGHCAYFDYVGCDKWKNECNNCPQKQSYPKSIIDNSKWNYNKKKDLFTNVDMTIVTPSKWLANLIKESFLKEYEIKVINNGIDTNIFKPRNKNFRIKYGLNDKIIILGVASTWDKRKGLEDFIELSRVIDDDYKIVLIGLNDKQLKKIPNNILGIKRTNNAIELAEAYSSADVFFNPTYEDNYPTVNLEAHACNIPIITYNTGGSVESCNEYDGKIVTKDTFINNYKTIIKESMCNTKAAHTIRDMCLEYEKIYFERKDA